LSTAGSGCNLAILVWRYLSCSFCLSAL